MECARPCKLAEICGLIAPDSFIPGYWTLVPWAEQRSDAPLGGSWRQWDGQHRPGEIDEIDPHMGDEVYPGKRVSRHRETGYGTRKRGFAPRDAQTATGETCVFFYLGNGVSEPGKRVPRRQFNAPRRKKLGALRQHNAPRRNSNTPRRHHNVP